MCSRRSPSRVVTLMIVGVSLWMARSGKLSSKVPPRDGAQRMKDETLVNHPPGGRVPADNRAAGGADLPIGEVFLRRCRRDFALSARRARRASSIRARRIRPCGSWSWLLAQLQGRDDCLLVGSGVATIAGDAARAVQAGRSRPRVHRVLRTDPLPGAAPAGAIRRHAHPAVASRTGTASSACSARRRRAWCCSRARPTP